MSYSKVSPAFGGLVDDAFASDLTYGIISASLKHLLER